VLDMPTRVEQVPAKVDPVTGVEITPAGQVEVGNYMPSENDSLPIWKHMFGDFMKTNAFEALAPEMQTVAQQVWQAIQFQEAQQAQRALDAQNAQAMQLGAENAAKPQVKGVPSQPGVSAPAQQIP
jgi:hypothetical protein